MITQDPKYIKDWYKQCARWNGGIQQVKYILGRKILKPRLLFTFYGCLLEGIIGNTLFLLFILSLPILYYMPYNGLIESDLILYYGLADLSVTYVFLFLAFWVRNWHGPTNKKLITRFCPIGEVTKCFLPYYIGRILNSITFLWGWGKHAVDYHIRGMRSWEAIWNRPHEVNNINDTEENKNDLNLRGVK